MSNLFYLPTDCPQREKNGWTADAALSAEQFLYNFDCGKTLAEWLVNVCKAQRSDGMMPGIVPTCGWGYKWGNGPAWDCVITEIPYQLYRFYGDTSVIENALPTILRYFDFISTVINADGLVDFGLGDWCEAETEQCQDYSTPVQYTNALTLLDMANKTLRMLDVLQGDYITQRAKMEEEKQRFTQSFRNNYVKAGRIIGKDLLKARHITDLKRGETLELAIDGYFSGVGSNSCGPELPEDKRITDKVLNFGVYLRFE